MAKIMYVIHEVGGDVPGNIKKIQEVCRKYHTQEVIPFAPYLLALQYLDDSNPEERALGITANTEFILRGIIDEMGVFGTKIGRGGFGELKLGTRLCIPIKVYDKRVAVDVRYALDGIKKGIALMEYLVATRKLKNGNTLFFRRDADSDIVLIESETVLDQTGKDVTRFVPIPQHWDEMHEGWLALEERCKTLSAEAMTMAKSRFYDAVTREYDKCGPINIEKALNAIQDN